MRAFEGRSNRATYWTAIAVIVALMVAVTLWAGKPPHIAEIVLIFVGVPRLHDIGKSGWLVLWPLGLELVGGIGALIFLPRETALQVLGVVMLIIAGLMIWLGCIPGQDSENRFGAPPASGIRWGKPKKS